MKKQALFLACVMAFSNVIAQTLPQGALPGTFKIGENKTVYFSQGNLIHNDDGSWSFAEHQYDVPGKKGLFAWATSGYGDPETIPQGRNICFNVFEGSHYANFDWGVYNPITNGGNQPGLWRTLTREEWEYLLKEENHHHEWTTIEGQKGLKVMADDNEHFLFLPATGEIGVGASDITDQDAGYYWTSIAGTDSKDYAEGYMFTSGNIELMGNANRKEKMSVRLVYDAPAWITVSDRGDNSTLLSGYKSNSYSTNVHIERSLTSGMSNTLTLPFDVEEAEMAALFGEGYELWQLDETNTGSIDVEAQLFEVNLQSAKSIEAGTPYLVTPTQAVTNMHFYNRTIKVATNEECIAGNESDLVQFCGLLDQTHLEAGNKNYLFLYPNNTLVWPADGDTGSMYSLRAYFKINPSGQSANAPLQQFAPRMVIRPSSVPTALEQSQIPNHKSQITNHNSQIKLLENGQFMIIRKDGKMYNILGVGE